MRQRRPLWTLAEPPRRATAWARGTGEVGTVGGIPPWGPLAGRRARGPGAAELGAADGDRAPLSSAENLSAKLDR
jgi:hypothetical protein